MHDANHPRGGPGCFSSGPLVSITGEVKDCQQVAYIKKRLQEKRKKEEYSSNRIMVVT